jgi:2',3'-cyclic-nucleotide 2'-phosphodiesterase
MIKILFFGDIIGHYGREFVIQHTPRLRAEMKIDFVIANGENAAGGFGLTEETAKDLLRVVDGLTTGNHVWDQRQFMHEIDHVDHVCRPVNLPPSAPGRDFFILEKNGFKLGVFCAMGRTFMGNLSLDCPFRCSQKMIENIKGRTNAIIVDIHAEATGEKQAFGWYLDGKVSAVIGTHTHVMTADERIFPKGTAFLTDAGMCGSFDSVIGYKKDSIIEKMLDGIPRRFEVAEHNVKLNACIVELNPSTGMARKVDTLVMSC